MEVWILRDYTQPITPVTLPPSQRYFAYLLSHNAIAWALHLASELRSKDMCLALMRACDGHTDTRSQVVAAIAEAAYKLAQSKSGTSSVSYV